MMRAPIEERRAALVNAADCALIEMREALANADLDRFDALLAELFDTRDEVRGLDAVLPLVRAS